MDNSCEDSIVTLGEVLEAEQEMIEDANAVLGAGDDKNCTYAEGYMKRQPLYACLTCIPEAKQDSSKRAGICLACCYHCHDGHDLVELYTKRNFRCDCGNSKFPANTCNLNKAKDEENTLNNYNQNFSGVYCTCSRPYPDPEDQVSDEMIQCIICEDWYHTRHLDTKLPPMGSYAEMTCKKCIENHSFLLHYDNLCITIPKDMEDIPVEVENTEDKKANNVNEEKSANDSQNKENGTSENDSNVVENEKETEKEKADNETEAENEKKTENDKKDDVIEDNKKENSKGYIEETKPHNVIEENGTSESEKKEETNEVTTEKEKTLKHEGDGEVIPEKNQKVCTKPNEKSENICAKFWTNVNWRQKLCTCTECLNMYKEQNILFLIDAGDTVQSYEEKGKAKSLENAQKVEEDSIKFFNSVNRIPLMETLAAYNDLKENLTDYLKKFAENKKVVREEDIREFFSNFESRKKQKVEVPSMCR